MLIFTFSLNGQEITKSYFYNGRQVFLDLEPAEISITYNTPQNLQGINQDVNVVFDGLITSATPLYGAFGQLIEVNDEITEEQLHNYLNELNNLSHVVMAAPVYRNEKVRQAVSDEFIVRFSDQATQQEIENLNLTLGGSIVREIESGIKVLKISKSSGLNGLSAANLYYNSSDIVEWAEPNFIYPDRDLYNATVNDALHSNQWAHVNTGQSVATGSDPATVNGSAGADMDVDLAWDISSGDPDIIVAIIDSGVDLDHPDLDDNLVTGEDFSGDDDGPDAPGDEAHGTNCAGLVAAEGNNSIGVAGIAYECSIMPIQIFNSAGSAALADIAGAINYAWQNGADILSNSWGGGSPSATLETAINNAKTFGRGGDGCVVLFSSGNNANGVVNYPASLSTVIAVGASSMFDEKKNPGSADRQFWWGGNYGADLDIVAPTICYSTDIAGANGYSSTDYYSTFNGTSAACPNAAGVAALILSVNPNLSAAQVQDILQQSADRIETYPFDSNGWNKHVGHGRVNAYKALLAAQGDDGDAPVIAHTPEQSSNNTSARTISALITDASGIAGGLNQPVLYYRRTGSDGSGSWIAVTDLNGPSADVYEFIIPAQDLGIMIEYYISATDNSLHNHTVTFPFGGNGSLRPPVLLKYWVANLSMVSYNSADLGSWSSGAGSAIFDLNIPDDITLIDLDFDLSFSSTSGANLTHFVMLLEHPDGGRAGLVGKNSGSSYTGTTFDDEAVTPITDGGSAHSGTFIPDNHLDVFDGKSSVGDWEFRVYDAVSSGGGNVSAWSVNLTYTLDDAPLAVEMKSFKAVSTAGKARLTWKTESEQNNLGFVVLKSEAEDGHYVEIESYISNANLKGLGSSSLGREYTFTDHNVKQSNTYWYKIIDMDYNGKSREHGPLKVEIEKYSGLEPVSDLIPHKFGMEQNYPNPFNPHTQFVLNIPQVETELKASIIVYDVLGKKIKTLHAGFLIAGQYKVLWDGSNDHNIPVSAGMYIYTFSSSEFNEARRMLMIK
jgi:subtilisin family serine protease